MTHRTTEGYLSTFETQSTRYELTPPESPSYSWFYWRNAGGQEFKVFIPPENRDEYFKIADYNAPKSVKHSTANSWRNTNKCLSIAVYREADLINQLLKKVEKYKRNGRILSHSRVYEIWMYNVSDIKNNKRKQRSLYATYRTSIMVDDQYFIEFINMAIECGVKRFHKDYEKQVKHYIR